MSAPVKAFDAAPMRAAMQRPVDDDLLAGVSCAVLVGRETAAVHCTGWADRERGIALREDHLFRAFSNTKLVTTCAALLLFEAGRFGLDDPIDRFIPALANRRVLRAGATAIDDTEPARGPITVRHLLTHTAGLSYGLFDPGTPIYAAYRNGRVLNPLTPLSDMIIGLIKAPVFGIIIAMMGCFQGMQVSGNAESVGTRTTRAVVESIFVVIVLDAFFAVFFSALGYN